MTNASTNAKTAPTGHCHGIARAYRAAPVRYSDRSAITHPGVDRGCPARIRLRDDEHARPPYRSQIAAEPYIESDTRTWGSECEI